MTKFSVTYIAMVCHEANRAYCQTLGDLSQYPWDLASAAQRGSAIKGVEFHLASLERGIVPPPSASHDSWLKDKAEAGWKYGPIKNEAAKEHPCFVSYLELPLDQRIKDYLFGGIVKAFFEASSDLH